MPSVRQAFITRIAISDRLATRILLNNLSIIFFRAVTNPFVTAISCSQERIPDCALNCHGERSRTMTVYLVRSPFDSAQGDLYSLFHRPLFLRHSCTSGKRDNLFFSYHCQEHKAHHPVRFYLSYLGCISCTGFVN
jgi:hypothetical protein